MHRHGKSKLPESHSAKGKYRESEEICENFHNLTAQTPSASKQTVAVSLTDDVEKKTEMDEMESNKRIRGLVSHT